LCIGIFLFGLSFYLRPRKHPIVFIFISSLAMGFTTSSALDFFSKDCDVKIAFESAQIPVSNYIFIFIGIGIIVLSTLFYLEILFEISKVVQNRKPKVKHK